MIHETLLKSPTRQKKRHKTKYAIQNNNWNSKCTEKKKYKYLQTPGLEKTWIKHWHNDQKHKWI